MPTPAEITRIAEEHAQLSHNLTDFDHAPAELRDTSELLASIEKDLSVREARMDKLIAKRKSEHKDLDKLQRSGTKRFLIRMKHGGKKEGLERRLEKEEREYVEAAQEEHNESRAIEELKAAAENARSKKGELETQVLLRKEMLQRIDDLYESAFEGPSPDFPEEDAAEDELREAEVHFEHMQARLSHEKTVFELLDQAASRANEALSALQSANMYATYDTFNIGGGIWGQMAEADDLLRAQTLAAQAKRFMDRARGSQSAVKDVPCGKIVSPEWLNVVFDNMYTDFMFQQKIKQSIESMTAYQKGIFAECHASEERIKTHSNDARDAKEFLAGKRRALVSVRREILRRVREEGGVRVFSGPDAGREGVEGVAPPLPTYNSQPEEGARVLATGVNNGAGGVAMPTPTHAGESGPTPPRYNSQPDPASSSPPLFPQPENEAARNANGGEQPRSLYAPPPGPPPGHPSLNTGRRSPATFSPPSSPSISLMRMPEATHHAHSESELRVNAFVPERAESPGELQMPGRYPLNANGSTAEPTRASTSFASNNPYRTAI